MSIVQTHIILLLGVQRGSLVRVCSICHSVCIFVSFLWGGGGGAFLIQHAQSFFFFEFMGDFKSSLGVPETKEFNDK